MSIWLYETVRECSDEAKIEMLHRTSCLYCQTSLTPALDDQRDYELHEFMNYGLSDGFRTSVNVAIGICNACGWWRFAEARVVPGPALVPPPPTYHLSMGILKSFDPADATNPISEVRDYLMARYDSRFLIHPRVFEEVVASVFRDHGYSVRVTDYSGDDGIDVILDHDDGTTIGVQVKRYKDRISVAQLRELTGALVINGLTKGIFVTTSEFQSGAARTASMSEQRGHPIELMDAPGFLKTLEIAQLSSAGELRECKPWGKISRWGE